MTWTPVFEEKSAQCRTDGGQTTAHGAWQVFFRSVGRQRRSNRRIGEAAPGVQRNKNGDAVF